MAPLCCIPRRRSHIYLPSDEDLQHNPAPRFAILIEPKGPSPRVSVSSHYRRQRPVTISDTIPEESTLSTHLLSEKEDLILNEAEVEAELVGSQRNSIASDLSSTVSLPSTRITSMTSTYTGTSRTSNDSMAPPPYDSPQPLIDYGDNEYTTSRSAGDLFRDIQRRIAASEEDNLMDMQDEYTSTPRRQ